MVKEVVEREEKQGEKGGFEKGRWCKKEEGIGDGQKLGKLRKQKAKGVIFENQLKEKRYLGQGWEQARGEKKKERERWKGIEE